MNRSKWVGLFYKTNEQLNVSSFTRKPSSLKPCASPTTYGMQQLTASKSDGKLGKTQKVRIIVEPRRSRE
jgi:hypothetical protein